MGVLLSRRSLTEAAVFGRFPSPKDECFGEAAGSLGGFSGFFLSDSIVR